MFSHKNIALACLFSLFFVSSAFCAEENAKRNENRIEVATLGQITAQRALLESLKLEVDIKSKAKEIQELEAPTLLNAPLIAPDNLLNALAVPPVSANTHSSNGVDGVSTSAPSRSGNRILSVHGTDSQKLSAKILYHGRTFTLKQGEYFSGERVKISRSKVSFGNTILTLE